MKIRLLAILLLAALLVSCATIAPKPSDLAPEPGQLVGRKPESQGVPAQVVLEEPGIVRPESAEVLRRLEEQNREFNERIRQVIDRSPRREAGSAQPPLAERALGEAQPLSMNFYDADLVEVIRLFMSLLDADYILHPQVSGRVSLSVADSYRPDQIRNLLEGILRINGMVMVDVDGVYEFMPLSRAPSQVIPGGMHFPEDGLTPRRGQLIQAFRLDFIPAEELTTIVKPYLSEGGQVFTHDASGVMLVCDFPHALARIAQLIELFDVSVFANIHAATYTLRSVQADDAAVELEDIAKTFRLTSERGVRAQVSFLPLARLNMLLVLTQDEHVLEFIEIWVQELDRELPSYIQEQYGEGVYVYYAQYGDATEIAASLQGLFEYEPPAEEEGNGRQRLPGEIASRNRPAAPEAESEGSGPQVLTTEMPPLIRDAPFPTPAREAASSTGKLSGPVTFVVDEANNAVLLRCTTVDYPKILSVIEKLDQYPRQVLIEVVIAEVSLTEDTQLGMEWSMLDYKDGVTQQAALVTGIADSIPTGFSYAISSTERLRASLRLSAQDGHARILSTPTLLTSDNKPAVINIGEEVPVPTSSLTRFDDTDPNRRSQEVTIQYRDTGIILKVTPKINKQGMVRMEISQEVSTWRTQQVAGTDYPIITTRHASTHVAVNDQQTVVIAGLMKQEQNDTMSGIPGLNRIPVLKYLFGYERRRFDNSELILFITPHVVLDEQDSAFITRDFLQRLDRIKAGMR